MKSIYLSALMLCLSFCFAQAQTQTNYQVQTTKAVKLGTTPPVRHLTPRAATGAEKRQDGKRRKQVPPNFFGQAQRPRTLVENAQPRGEDPVRQKSNGRNTGIPIEPLVNVQGQSFAGPPDPTGDVGPDHYVHEVNTSVIEVFDKMGNSLNTFSSNTLWNEVGATGAGDPIILYDQEVNRWIITEFIGPFDGNAMLVGISEDADPNSGYTVYSFSTPTFPDYPKYSVWKDFYCVATNENGGETLVAYFLDKNAMLAGEDEVDIQRFTLAANAGGGGPGINVFAPADWSGQVAPNSSDPIMLSMNDDAWGGSTEDMITVHTFNIDWENPDNTSVSSEPLTASPFDTDPCFPDSGQFGQCVPQAGGEGVSGIPEIIMNQVHYRNFGTHESLVCAFTVDAEPGNNKAGIRWMEMRKTSGESWSIYQEGTYAPDDGFSRFVPSIAMDAKGNIGLMYSASSPETFIDLRFTGRRAIDPLGEMTVEEYILADGESTLITGTRFGDYAHMTIDPMDESTFWLTGEYAGANNDGATRIASFKLRRDTTDFGVTALLSPTNSPDLTASETVSMQITNLGLDTQSVFQVGYILENEAPVIDNVMFELHPDSVYEHSFAQTIDLSVIGDYSLRTFVVLDGDQAIFNDTLRSVVSKLPRFDAGITGTDGLEFVQCADSTTVLLELTNFGTEVLEMVNINPELNGNMLPTVQWTGMLETGESTQVEVELPGLINGTNELIATTSEPNGMTDEIMVNDSFSRSFDAVADGGIGAIIEIQTDDWPFETTWVITDDETGNVVSSGGPYDMQNNLFTTEVCLDSEKCYTFTIFDDYGDGICCAYGFGFYRILDSEGNILVSGNGEFADEESTQFCAEFECLLTATTEASPETASGTNDGSILVTPANGAGPFLFSIDGGETFQDFELFSNLPGGEYEILISDANGCTTTVSVVVDILNSLEVLENDAAIVVFPNPTEGVFRINAKNLSSNNIMIDWTLYNTEGKIVQTGKLAKYDDTHTAMVSLYAYPTGTYYLSIDDTAVRHMTKIVRQ